MKWSSDNDFGTDVPIAVSPEDIATVAHMVHQRVPASDIPQVLGMLLGVTA